MDIYEHILEVTHNGGSGMVVTVVDKVGEGPCEIGKKMLVTKDQAFGTVGGGALEYEARELAKQWLRDHKQGLVRYTLNEGKILDDTVTLPMACGGLVTLFFERIGKKGRVYVFGAGHVGQALVHVLRTLPFHISVIDPRPEVTQGFSGADVVYTMDFTAFMTSYPLESESYIVVCTPSHKSDYNVLHECIRQELNPKYIGMLCSKKKLGDYLKKTHDTFGQVDLSHFYSPIGLELGGGSPEEIAIAITAEILAVSYDKKGHRHMRELNPLNEASNHYNGSSQ